MPYELLSEATSSLTLSQQNQDEEIHKEIITVTYEDLANKRQSHPSFLRFSDAADETLLSQPS